MYNVHSIFDIQISKSKKGDFQAQFQVVKSNVKHFHSFRRILVSTESISGQYFENYPTVMI